MLDSLVRVSRRVGGAADYSQQKGKPCTEVHSEQSLLTRTLRERSQERRGSAASEEAKPNFTHALGPLPEVRCVNGQRNAASSNMAPNAESLRIPNERTTRPSKHEPLPATSRTPPFTTTQFHVLLNSLFKVLFNFPSRYLFAIGLGVIFSLTWSLPRTLSCTPKQLDSREKVSAALQPPYGPITLYGPWPQSRWTWTGRSTARRLSRTPHSARPRWPAVW